MNSSSTDATIQAGLSRAHQLSPFRYPGGKTWLVPQIRLWFGAQAQKPIEFIEPFAGGSTVGLTVAQEAMAEHVTLVEIDEAVAAVWKVIINGEDDVWLLAERIQRFDMSDQTVELELGRQPKTLNDLAFRTILWNRISRGGILAPGAGRLKKGENGKGLASRWYPDTLLKRITRIVELRERITFVEGDGLQMIEKLAACTENVFFIDPPYTASSSGAGRRLYTHSVIDHEALFRLVTKVEGDFLMTYDNHPDVRRLALRHSLDLEEIEMRNTHHSKRTELLIGKDLSWMRRSVKADNSQFAV